MFKKLIILMLVTVAISTKVPAQDFLYSVTLSDSNGQTLPLNTIFPIVQIRLWTSQTDGSVSYTENFTDVNVAEGVFDIIIGQNGSLTQLPDLFEHQFVEISIQVNSEAQMETLTPRVRLSSMPMAVDSYRVGGLTRAEIEAQINTATQSFSSSDAVTSVLADSRVIQKNVLLDLNTISDVLMFSVDSTITSTKISVINTSNITVFEIDSRGKVNASTFMGDGSQLSGLVSLQGNQIISGTKTFSDLDTHFLGTVNAVRFVGDGADLVNVAASSLQNNIIDSSKLDSLAVTSGNIAVQAVSSIQLEDLAVTNSKIAINAVSTGQIINAAITSDKLASGIVSGSKLSPNLTAPGIFHIAGSNSTDSFKVTTLGANLPSIVVNSSGFVGVMTATPSHEFTVNGDIKANKFYGDGSSLSGVGGVITSGSVSSDKIATGAITSQKLSTNISIEGYLSIGGTILKTDSSTALGLSSHTHVNLGWSSITGSSTNTFSYVSITGGQWNTAEANYGFIGGGKSNKISGVADVIGGGVNNFVDGSYSVISGGAENLITGSYSVIPGGRMMHVVADNSYGFNADSIMWTVSKSSVASFMGVSMGIGTTNPLAMLDIKPNSSNTSLVARTSSDDSVGLLEVTTHVRIGGASATVTTDAVLVINGNIKFNDVVRSTWPLGSSSGAFSDSGTYAFYNGSVSIGQITSPTAELEVNGDLKATRFEGDGSLLTNILGNSITINSITSSQLAMDAVTAGNIVTGAVLQSSIANSAVSSLAIAHMAVTTSKISMSAVTGGNILDESITQADLAASSVTTGSIANFAVTTLAINQYAVTTMAISMSAITSYALADLAVTTSKISLNAVTSGSIVNNSITQEDLAASSVTTDSIADFAVTTLAINQYAVTTLAMSMSAITSYALADLAVTTSKIGIHAVTAGNIQPSSITSQSLSINAITTSMMSFPLVTGGSFVPGVLELQSRLNLTGNTGMPALQVLTSITAGQPTFLIHESGRLGTNSADPQSWVELLGPINPFESRNILWVATSAAALVPSLVVTSNSLIGVNTATPTASLHVIGGSTDIMKLATSVQSAPSFVFSSSGKFGINISQPIAAVHVLESSTLPLMIATNPLNPLNPALVVDQEGLVTIGTIPTRFPTPSFRPFKFNITGGALCIDTYSNCVSRRQTNPDSEGKIYAVTAAFSGADYGEYFASEDQLSAGDLVGINIKTGKVRAYQSGDVLIGVVSTKPGVVGNAQANKDSHSLVALMGQVPVNQEQVVIENGMVYTHDGLSLGSLLDDGKVYINIGSDKFETVRMKHKLKQLESELSSIKRQLKHLMQNSH